MSKRNGKVRHRNKLVQSSDYVKALCEAMETRFLELCELFGRVTGGEQLPIDDEIKGHIEQWRTVVVRHKRGDYRNTSSEYNSMKEVAQWTVDMKCAICEQPPIKVEHPE